MQYLFLYLSAIDAVFSNILVFLCDIIYKRMTKNCVKAEREWRTWAAICVSYRTISAICIVFFAELDIYNARDYGIIIM